MKLSVQFSAGYPVMEREQFCIDHRNKIKVLDPVAKDLISKK